ncbi:Uncharacterised protein [Tsukamurella paurometabola]|uniref:Uncharacterized protein n=1 Tax=Tsukamurella paurometabola TaxID=2061 RepID=A0A3P8ME60_TSUPA|nr:Uncharacterised protein [Tsukamurella paurometabola]
MSQNTSSTTADGASEPAEFVPGAFVRDQYDSELGLFDNRAAEALGALAAVRVADLRRAGMDFPAPPTNGEVVAWCRGRGRVWNPPQRAGADLHTVRAALGGVHPAYRVALVDLVEHERHGEAWEAVARELNTVARGARRGSERPTTLTPGQLIEAGLTADQIRTLPRATKAATARSVELVETWDAEARLVASERGSEAKAARAACSLAIPEPINLAEYVRQTPRQIVHDLLPYGLGLGLFAEKKAGKSTAVMELVRALISGDKFLGQFDTELPEDARVVLLDTEMGVDLLHEEYVTNGVLAPDEAARFDVFDLLGTPALADVRTEAVRARWRERITPGSFIIIDCLYKVLGALSIGENDDAVGRVITGFEQLVTECGAVGWVLVHHLGKDPTKGARGHGSIEGSMAVLSYLRLTGSLTDPREFWAFGRGGVSIEPLLLSYDDHQLRVDESRLVRKARARDDKQRDIDLKVQKLVRENPGMSVRFFQELEKDQRGGIGSKAIRDSIARQLQATPPTIKNLGTEHKSELHPADPYNA